MTSSEIIDRAEGQITFKRGSYSGRYDVQVANERIGWIVKVDEGWNAYLRSDLTYLTSLAASQAATPSVRIGTLRTRQEAAREMIADAVIHYGWED